MAEDYKPRILIVDDVAKNIQVVASILSREGYEISFAQHGKTALDHIHKYNFDLILLDVMMPEMSGFDVCKALKADKATIDIPIIFLTAKTDAESIVTGFETGGVDYITKPFNSAELLARVKTHLRLRETEKSLRTNEAKLTELNNTKDKFFSIIAHDLKNPFNNIIGLADILIHDDSEMGSKDRMDMYQMLMQAAQGAYDLLENLLEWSRSQTGRIRFEPMPVLALDLVDKVFSLLQANASKKNIAQVVNVPKDLIVNADSNMLTTVLRNLVSNALKFTNAGGSVAINVKKQDDMALFAIVDNGIGMTADVQEKLFRLDVHHSTSGTDDEQGTGLGLVLCREFMERHGGSIWVESEVDKGSTFYFTLPLFKIDATE